MAAELILFKSEPLRFELTEFRAEVNRYAISPLEVPSKFLAHMADIQIAMLSILQERTLTIDQRLIVLGFFLDKLAEISAGELDTTALLRLIDAYESKQFLAEQVPRMLASVTFKPQRFHELMRKIFKSLYGNEGVQFIDAQLTPQLVDARKNFIANHAAFLENYLVNELFMNCYPWRFTAGIAINYAMFIATYKVFELIIATVRGKAELIKTVGQFAIQAAHNGSIHNKIVKHLTGNSFGLMETFLDTKRAVL